MAFDILEVSLTLVLILLAADFLSGFFHWVEDSYGSEDWPIIGSFVTQANVLHHFDPRHMTAHSWWDSARIPLILSTILLCLAYLLGFFGWPLCLLAVMAANSNEVHKWAHRSKSENGKVVTLLQRLGLVQSRAHHAKHHQRDKNTHYCVVTNFLNPVLDGVGFWRGLELAITLATGVKRRADPSVGASRRSYSVPPCTNGRCRRRSSAAPFG